MTDLSVLSQEGESYNRLFGNNKLSAQSPRQADRLFYSNNINNNTVNSFINTGYTASNTGYIPSSVNTYNATVNSLTKLNGTPTGGAASISSNQGLFGAKDGIGGGGMGYAKAMAKGATVGSILGPIGTAIGAGIGAIAHKVSNNNQRNNNNTNNLAPVPQTVQEAVEKKQDTSDKAMSNNRYYQLYKGMKDAGYNDEIAMTVSSLAAHNKGEMNKARDMERAINADRILAGGSNVLNQFNERLANQNGVVYSAPSFGSLVNLGGAVGYGL